MDTDKVTAFFRKVAPSLKSIALWRSAPLGFNAFSLVSDFYYRETFHSDILWAILDPASPHGEGALFLRLFVEFLAEEAERTLKEPGAKLNRDVPGLLRGLVVDESTTVEREKGKIDIKITASNGTIVIENKIYNAPDMERQLPRYVDLCREWNEKVVAVVYLTAAREKEPDRSTYLPGDDEKVDPLLLRVAGHLKGQSNLVQGWIERCELAAKGFNTRSILDQYAELLRHQAGETMETNEMTNVITALGSSDINYSEILAALQAAPETLAKMIVTEFQKASRKQGAGYSSVKLYQKTTAYFELDPISIQTKSGSDDAVIHIDVRCQSPNSEAISFFVYMHEEWNERFLELVRGFAPNSHFPGKGGRIYLPYDRDQAFRETGKLFERLSTLLKYLADRRQIMVDICRKASKEEESASDAGC